MILPSCQTRGDSSILQTASVLSGEEAAALYKEYLETEENEKVRWNYLYSLFEAEDFESCLEETEIAIGLYPSNIRFLYLKALVLEEKGEKEREIEVLEKVREMNPGEVFVLERLLSLYSDVDSEKAKETAKSLIAYDNKNYLAVEYLSKDSEFYSILLKTLKPKEEVKAEEDSLEKAEEESTEN